MSVSSLSSGYAAKCSSCVTRAPACAVSTLQLHALLLSPRETAVPHLTTCGCRAAEKAAAAEEKKRHKKNLKVLSFGDDVEEDEEDDLAPRVMKSAHDATKDPRCSRSK